MKRSIVISVGLLLVLAACSSDSKSASSSSSSVTTTTAGSSSSSASSSASSSSAVAAGPTTAVAGLKAAQNAKVGKQIIVTDTGMTVYLFEPDGSSKTTTVPAGIKSNWPAVVGPTNVTITGIDPTKLGVATDGTGQLTYNGHLLYTFVGDSAAGDANGQGLGGIWFTLSTTGDKNA